MKGLTPRKAPRVPLFVTAMTVVTIALLLLSANAWAQPVIKQGSEQEVLALFKPFSMGSEITPGWRLHNVSIGKTTVTCEVLGLNGDDFSLTVTLRQQDSLDQLQRLFSTNQKVPISFEIAHTAASPKSLAAATALQEAITQNDTGQFVDKLTRSDNTEDLLVVSTIFNDVTLIWILVFLVAVALIARTLEDTNRASPLKARYQHVAAVALALGLFTLCVVVRTVGPYPVHSDTTVDLAHGANCWTNGCSAGRGSSAFLEHGTLWPRLIGSIRAGHVSLYGFGWFLNFANALACALLTYFVARRFGIFSACAAGLIYLAFSEELSPQLWNPDLLPLPAALCALTTWKAVESNHRQWSFFAGVCIGIGLESHVATLGLYPGLVIGLLLCGRQGWRNVIASGAGLVAVHTVLSPLAAWRNLLAIANLGGGSIVALGLVAIFLFARFAPNISVTRRSCVAAVATITVYVAAGTLTQKANSLHDQRYVLPILGHLVLVGAYLLSMLEQQVTARWRTALHLALTPLVLFGLAYEPAFEHHDEKTPFFALRATTSKTAPHWHLDDLPIARKQLIAHGPVRFDALAVTGGTPVMEALMLYNDVKVANIDGPTEHRIFLLSLPPGPEPNVPPDWTLEKTPSGYVVFGILPGRRWVEFSRYTWRIGNVTTEVDLRTPLSTKARRLYWSEGKTPPEPMWPSRKDLSRCLEENPDSHLEYEVNVHLDGSGEERSLLLAHKENAEQERGFMFYEIRGAETTSELPGREVNIRATTKGHATLVLKRATRNSDNSYYPAAIPTIFEVPIGNRPIRALLHGAL